MAIITGAEDSLDDSKAAALFAESLAQCSMLLARTPTNVSALYCRVAALCGLARFSEAFAALDEAMKVCKEFGHLHNLQDDLKLIADTRKNPRRIAGGLALLKKDDRIRTEFPEGSGSFKTPAARTPKHLPFEHIKIMESVASVMQQHKWTDRVKLKLKLLVSSATPSAEAQESPKKV
jgi:hypothetical protein